MPGSLVAASLENIGQPVLVIEERQEIVNELRSRGIEVISGMQITRTIGGCQYCGRTMAYQRHSKSV